MLKYGAWDLPGMDYFQSENSFKGSKNNLRFAVTCGDEGFKVLTWTGEKCLEYAENISEKHFELNEQSLYDINEYLTDEYKAQEA